VPRAKGPEAPPDDEGRREETSLGVVLFEDMEASTALKRAVTKRADEHSYQELRKEHDALVKRVITRDDGGQVIKWTGDGVIALFRAPSVAVERAVEIQEQMRLHPRMKVRIGIDLGEIRVESVDGRATDVFGAHVDTAARAMSLADGGHICVTAPVYRDAFSWITKTRIAWKKHGLYRAKRGEAPLEVYQPYNANHQRPMRRLRGERTEEEPPKGTKPKAEERRSSAPVAGADHEIELIRPWEAVARDGHDFAEKGAGTMYWFKVPLGGLSYPEGFRHFLQPALENDRIGKIRFVLDSSSHTVMEIWSQVVLPLTQQWAEQSGLDHELDEARSSFTFRSPRGRDRRMGWAAVDLSAEFTPCFKLFVDDPDSDEVSEHTAQIFLSTAARMIRLSDGTMHTIRIPDAVLRVRPGRHEGLLHALNAVANQWDSMFW
jgi:class 3 adenylate cyclase